MSTDLIIVLALLVTTIVLLVIGKPRADIVMLLLIAAFPITGVLTVPETLAGFADPTILLFAALFVVGEGISQSGVSYSVGEWLDQHAGASPDRLVVLLMISVGAISAIMSATAVVALFIPIVLSLSTKTGFSPRRLMMPMSVAAMVGGTLTLIGTPPNLLVNSEMQRTTGEAFGFYSITPFGLALFALAVVYMLFAQRWLSTGKVAEATMSRPTFPSLIARYEVDRNTHEYRVLKASPLVGKKLDEIETPESDYFVLAVERRRRFQKARMLTGRRTTLHAGDVLILDEELTPEELTDLGVAFEADSEEFFDAYTHQVGMTEVMVPPESNLVGQSVRSLRLRSEHGVTVLGMRQAGKTASHDFLNQPLKPGATLLVAGGWSAIQRLRAVSRDVVALRLPREGDQSAPTADRAPFALVSLTVMIALMVTGVVPTFAAAIIGALLMGAFKVVDFTSAYRSINWQLLLVIAGMFTFTAALQNTNAIGLAAQGLIGAFGSFGPTIMLIVLFVLTALVGLFISNTVTAILVAPVGIAIATSLELSPMPFAMVMMLAASCAFMTPVSSPVNMLVQEPGQYTFGDFAKVGVPFTVLALILTVFLVPLLLPFSP